MGETNQISNSINILQNNLDSIARVSEWAAKMGYNCPKKFARKFLHHYYQRPQPCLQQIRLSSILQDLRKGELSNFHIAKKHGIPDEIALNKYINYHFDCSPTDVKRMPENELSKKLEIFGSKVR